MKNILVLTIGTLSLPLIAMEYGWNRRQSPALSLSEQLDLHRENMRKKYYPDVDAAQTPEGKKLAYAYFYGQLMKRPLPNGIPFEQAYIYWGEHKANLNDPIIPVLKDYARQVLTLAFVLRNSSLKKEEERWELFKAVDAINWEMRIKEEKKWQKVKDTIDQFNVFKRQRYFTH